jgi:hypothetical protein
LSATARTDGFSKDETGATFKKAPKAKGKAEKAIRLGFDD